MAVSDDEHHYDLFYGRMFLVTSRWQRERLVLLGLREEWLSQLSLHFPATSLSIEIDPDPEPGPTIHWSWWITFTIDDAEFDAMSGEDVPDMVFEDEQGHFEDWVQPDQVIDYIRRRIAPAPS